jgi:histidinol-phosphate aminotransferase
MSQLSFTRRQWLKAGGLLAGNLVAGFGAARPLQLPAPAAPVLLNGEQHSWGPSPDVADAVYSAASRTQQSSVELAAKLRHQIAKTERVPENQILLGNGSTELFGLALAAASSTSRSVVAADPTYEQWMQYAERLGGELTRVPITERWGVDFAAMLPLVKAKQGLVYLNNPNSPMGTLLQPEEMRPFCVQAAQHALVVVDEASLDYVENMDRCSMVQSIREGQENVVVLRTFSKLYALPGLRIGYSLAGPRTTDRLRHLQAAPDQQLSIPALEAAIVAHRDKRHAQMVRQAAMHMRQSFSNWLGRNGIYSNPSFGASYSFSLDSFPAIAPKYLALKGIQLHYFQARGTSWGRTALGTREQMTQLVECLGELRRTFPLRPQPIKLSMHLGS